MTKKQIFILIYNENMVSEIWGHANIIGQGIDTGKIFDGDTTSQAGLNKGDQDTFKKEAENDIVKKIGGGNPNIWGDGPEDSD